MCVEVYRKIKMYIFSMFIIIHASLDFVNDIESAPNENFISGF